MILVFLVQHFSLNYHFLLQVLLFFFVFPFLWQTSYSTKHKMFLINKMTGRLWNTDEISTVFVFLNIQSLVWQCLCNKDRLCCFLEYQEYRMSIFGFVLFCVIYKVICLPQLLGLTCHLFETECMPVKYIRLYPEFQDAKL